jgi:SpoVK/Ycf46/Vps4 family AAA+-type ATPase
MDDATLASLEAALGQSPDNAALIAVVARALLERGERDRLRALLGRVALEKLTDPDARRVVGRALSELERAEEALPLLDGEDPETLIVRARALGALGRRDDALAAYRRAVAANPTLENPELLVLLEARVREPAGGKGPRLRVISNDDTDGSEVARLLLPASEKITFSDVGGLDEIKRQIEKRIILPFKKPSLFQRFKKRVGGGILLYGPPGCGKTLLARATAGECDAGFFNVAISDILDMYIGESERKLRAIFDKARASPPAVLFFDELEALAGKRQYTRESTSSKLVSQFLSEMDGFAKNNHGVLILGATNVPWAVDPAFRRPGRFDRVLFVPPPDRDARRAILERLLAARPTAEKIDADELARKTSGFSGADLEQLVENASDRAIEASLQQGAEVPIARAHVAAALCETRPTTLDWLTTARNYARYANEAGQYDEVLEFLERHGRA